MNNQFDIKKMAHLSRLQLDSDSADMQNKLNKVLDFINELEKVDVSDTEALSHPIENNQPLRADAVSEEDQRSKLQQGAPETHSGVYIVPQVVE